MTRRIVALALTALVLLGTAGCAAGSIGPSASSAPSPSVAAPSESGTASAEACDRLRATIDNVRETFERSATEDPARVLEIMKDAVDELEAAAGDVSDGAVVPLIPEFRGILEQAVVVLEGVAQGDLTKLAELPALADDCRQLSEQFRALCPAA